MVRNAFRLTAAALAVTALLDFAACNYTDGPCYRREDIEGTGSDGAGGGTIVPGWGGYGDVPPEPQDTTDPQPVDCNLEEQPVKGDDKGDDSSSCGESIGSVTEGETLTYCSGACQDKCPTGGVNGFSPSVFKFSTLIPDDGNGVAGGYQVASATLSFFRWTGLLPERWTCPVTVGMPIRTVVHGTISPGTAASMTAGIASTVSFALMNGKPELPPGIFCSRLVYSMREAFKAQYPSLGASVTL